MIEPTPPNPNSHLHAFNFQTGRPRFHFEEGGGAAGGGAAGGAAGAAAGVAAGGATPWHTGIDPEFIGHANNKGWKLDDPKEAFSAAAKVARDLERHFGAPADRILKMPSSDAKPEEISAFRLRLGVPSDAKDYDFSAIKDAAGQPLAAPLADALRAASHEAGVPKDAAAKVAAAVVKHLDGARVTESTINAGKLAEERIKLEQNWGGKDSATYQYNHLQAIEGARRLGISQEAVKALEGQIGYSSVMDAMRKVGAARSEDIFVQQPGGGGGPAGQPTTREGAMARKAELMADKAWGARFTAGDSEARREYDRLNQMINGEAA